MTWNATCGCGSLADETIKYCRKVEARENENVKIMWFKLIAEVYEIKSFATTSLLYVELCITIQNLK